MKKKSMGLAIAACAVVVTIGIVWSVFSDYSWAIKLNWGISLPWKAGLTKIYERDSGPSFHGDGVCYHVYSYEYEDYIDLMFAWSPTEYPTNHYTTTSKAAEVWLGEIDVPAEERPDYKKCCTWHKAQEDNSEIILFWDSEQNRLYIVENFI